MEDETATQFDLLIAQWAERDSLYARGAKPLDDDAIKNVRIGRKREAGFLPPEDRGRAWHRAATWYPPEHGQGLS